MFFNFSRLCLYGNHYCQIGKFSKATELLYGNIAYNLIKSVLSSISMAHGSCYTAILHTILSNQYVW